MNTPSSLEQEAFRIAVASIRRHSMNPAEWKHTTIGNLHPSLVSLLPLEPGEMVITSAFLSATSWYAFTTRRIVSQLHGMHSELDPRHGITFDVANFKGIGPAGKAGAVPTEVGTVTSEKNGQSLQFEFETANASMAPTYACIFWSRALRFRHGPAFNAGPAGCSPIDA